MVINLGFYKRKPGLSREQFSRHWESIHGPLIRSIPNIDQYLIRYVQHHLTPDIVFPMPDGQLYDGFSEAWFPSIAARTELFGLPFFLQKVIEDERNFLDMEATRWLVIDEPKVMIPAPAETKPAFVA